MRTLSIIGTRPEAVKMAPVIEALGSMPGVDSRVCVTGQHREMLDQVLNLFGIHPDIDLDLMKPDQTLADLTANLFHALDRVLQDEHPDWVIVQGDTTTVMAAAVCAYYRQIRVAHVEAGLRSGDLYQPFPEEGNRRIVSVLAALNFAPTPHSAQLLLNEGVPPNRVLVTGNPVVDALLKISSQPQPDEATRLLQESGVLGGHRLILVTAHRRENFGKPIEDICTALRGLTDMYPGDVEIIYPVHLNPHIQAPVHRLLDGVPGIRLLAPLDYLPLVHLMKNATLILTDSGGIQEEATALQKPTLVLRRVTERPEGVKEGGLKLVGTDPGMIIQEACRLLDDPLAYSAMSQAKNPFGDGKSGARIARALVEYSDPG